MSETAREREGGSLTLRAIHLFGAKGVALALSYALPLLLVRRLTMEEFGLYKQVFLVVGTALAVAPLGFGMSAFYFLPRERTRQASIVANIVAFHFAIGLLVAIVLASWPGLLAHVFNSPELRPHARYIALLALLWTTGTFLEIVPVAMKDVRASTALIIGNQLSKTVLFLSAALVFPSVDAMIAAGVIYGCIQIALMSWYIPISATGDSSAITGTPRISTSTNVPSLRRRRPMPFTGRSAASRLYCAASPSVVLSVMSSSRFRPRASSSV